MLLWPNTFTSNIMMPEDDGDTTTDFSHLLRVSYCDISCDKISVLY